MNISLNKPTIVTFLIAVIVLISSCSGKTLIKKSELRVSSQMSSSIFLTPRAPDEKIVYLEIRNSSDKPIYIKERVEDKIRSAGYRITTSPNEANYVLQANILQVARTDLRSNSSMLEEGFGGAIIGSGLSTLISNSNQDNTNAAIVGVGISLAMDAMIEDVNYSVITDVQVKEKVQNGEVVNQKYESTLSQGSGSSVSQKSRNDSQWKTYQTRIVSVANKVNLEFEEAQSALTEGLARTIGGIF